MPLLLESGVCAPNITYCNIGSIKLTVVTDSAVGLASVRYYCLKMGVCTQGSLLTYMCDLNSTVKNCAATINTVAISQIRDENSQCQLYEACPIGNSWFEISAGM
jgi:hypothetical protein